MRKGHGRFCRLPRRLGFGRSVGHRSQSGYSLNGEQTFQRIHRGVPLMSRSLLGLRLKQLEAIAAIERRQRPRGWKYISTAGVNEIGLIIQLLGE